MEDEENNQLVFTGADKRLIDFVVMQIRTGAIIIEIPLWMLDGTSKNGLREVRALLELNGCKPVFLG